MKHIIITKQFLMTEHVDNGKSWFQISEETGCPYSTLLYRSRKFGFEKNRSIQDLSKKVFGDWTILRRAHSDKNGRSRWVCKCKCGKESEVDHSTLVRGRSKQCNNCKYVYGSSHQNWLGCGEISYSMWQRLGLITNRRKRKIPVEISIEYAWELFLKQKRRCAISGLDIKFGTSYNAKNKKETTASLDRIDSKFNYVKGNVQWVHKKINKMKQDLSMNEFVELCRNVHLQNTGEEDETLPLSGQER